jgi:aflatoxin B1 aldehyde reductase
MRTPRLYLGTMTFGWSSQTSSIIDETIASEMVRTFVLNQQQQQQQQTQSDLVNHNVCHIDTARIYAGGQTEPIVSYALKVQQQNQEYTTKPVFIVGTKAHPSQSGGLSPNGIKEQMNASFKAMPNISKFGEYYLHQPDPDHALLDSLQCLHDCYEQGLISVIGMSNYHASEMQRAFELCTEHKLTPPTVYQGLYNPLNRMIENELLPILRKNNCSFIAYNPLAGGLLTGKYQEKNIIPPGRFKDNPNYLPRFFTDTNFDAVSIISKACTDANISMVDATYLWLMHHSVLTENDGILVGASSIEQLQQNLNVLCSHQKERQLLPDSVLRAFDEGWNITNGAGVFPYWRSYSADMPNRAQLDQGASYDAAKKTT